MNGPTLDFDLTADRFALPDDMPLDWATSMDATRLQVAMLGLMKTKAISVLGLATSMDEVRLQGPPRPIKLKVHQL